MIDWARFGDMVLENVRKSKLLAVYPDRAAGVIANAARNAKDNGLSVFHEVERVMINIEAGAANG